MVHLNTNDLAHILEQIRIAEEHSRLMAEGVDPGVALSQLVTSPLIPMVCALWMAALTTSSLAWNGSEHRMR